jgi:hypothetical protein
MLIVIKVNAAMMSVIWPNVIMQILIMLSIITLSVIELNNIMILLCSHCTYIVPNVTILTSLCKSYCTEYHYTEGQCTLL